MQRRQGVESALASVFRGVELTELSFVAPPQPGAPLVVTYRFKASDYAAPELGERPAGGGTLWSLTLRAFPAKLGERYVQLASRKTGLLIAQDERAVLDLRVVLPPKAIRDGALSAPLALDTAFGLFRRSETAEGAAEVRLHEELVLPAQRVAPSAYAAFATFAASVDEAQTRRLRYRMDDSKQASRELRMQIQSGLAEHEPIVVQGQVGARHFINRPGE